MWNTETEIREEQELLTQIHNKLHIACCKSLFLVANNAERFEHPQVLERANQVQVILRPTISRPVRRGVRAPCGVHDQILIFFV
jgi:hypothetical protein